MSTDARLIRDDASLKASIERLGGAVGVDTEFMRVRTFYPIPALYQLAGNGEIVLVDGQADMTFAALKELLLDPQRSKVMHSCSEDLEVMAVHLDVRPTALIDTQLAHAFLASDLSAGYVKAVAHHLDVVLEQHATRSDWLKRPLDDTQIAYAREDAAYLLPLWDRQRAALAENGRLGWFREEMQRVLDTPPPTPETWYLGLRGIWRLSRRELAVLRALIAWREREARRRDAPRGWVVADEPLFVMARRPQLAAADAARLLSKRVGARYGKALAAAHAAGLADDDPPRRAPRPLKSQASQTVKRLRAVAQEAAEELGLAPELLARKRDVQALVRQHRDHGTFPAWFGGWRETLLGARFRDLMVEDA